MALLRLAHAGIRLGTRVVYLRYVAASVIALGTDVALFLLLIGANTPPTAASVIGYSAGILISVSCQSKPRRENTNSATGSASSAEGSASALAMPTTKVSNDS